MNETGVRVGTNAEERTRDTFCGFVRDAAH